MVPLHVVVIQFPAFLRFRYAGRLNPVLNNRADINVTW